VSGQARTLGDLRKVAQGGVSVLFASVFGSGLAYLYSIFLARSLGPKNFGVYALGLAIFNVTLLIAPLGFENGALRFVSTALGRGDRQAAQRTIAQVLALVLLSGICAGLLLAIASRPLAVGLYDNAQLAAVLPWFALAIPMSVIAAVLLDVIRAFQQVRYTVLVRYLWEPAARFALAAVLLGMGYALGGALAALVITSAGSLLIALGAARRIGAFSGGLGAALSGQGLRSLFVYCLPLTVSNVFGVIAPRSDILILGMWVSPEQVGVYSVAAQTAAVIALVLGGLTTMCAPVMGEIAATDDLRRLETLYATVCRWTLACTVPLFCLFAVFGTSILALFGQHFTEGAGAMAVLALGQLLYSAFGISGTLLLMFGHSRRFMANSILLGLFLVGSNLLLVPRFGMLGAACAVALSNAAIGCINLRQVYRIYRVQPFTVGMLKPVLAGIAASVVTWSLKGLFAPAATPVLVVVAAGLYVLALYLLRFEAADRQVLGTIVARIRPA
jgi:O-antigen/teichoic acid export membrane protein